MNDKFDSQKETLVSINHEISLLQQQIKYLLRNEKAAELLDLDVLMNRTHTIYDMICTISVGDNDEEQDFDIDPEALSALFGGMEEEEESEETESGELREAAERRDAPRASDVAKPQASDDVEMQASDDVEMQTSDDNEITVTEDVSVDEEEPITEEEPVVEEPAQQDEQPQESDDFGYFFRFEDIPLRETENGASACFDYAQQPTLSNQEKNDGRDARFCVSQHQDAKSCVSEEDDRIEEINGKTIHFMEETPIEDIPEKDRIEGEDLIQDDPFKMPAMEETPSQYGSIFEKDDMGFEMSNSETLGERMIDDDNSLNAKFQHTPVNDLKQAIGLNDKFLFVNELFGGSMERFNKSIENLNDLKTLNGAMIYLNELKVELQWNSSNEAYKKLWALVAQKFEYK